MIHDMSPPTTSSPLYTDCHVNDMSHYVIVADEALIQSLIHPGPGF